MALVKPNDDRTDAGNRRRAARRRARHLVAVADVLFARLKHLHGLTKPTVRLLRSAAVSWSLRLLPKKARAAEVRRLCRRMKIQLSTPQQRIVALALACMAQPPTGLAAATTPPGNRKQAVDGLAARLANLLILAERITELAAGGAADVTVDDDGQTVTIAVAGVKATGDNGTPSPLSAAAFLGAPVSHTSARRLPVAGHSTRRLGGPHASNGNGTAALPDPAIELWNQFSLRPLRIVYDCGAPGVVVPPRPVAVPGEPSAEVARRILQRHLEQLLSRQYGLAYGDDAEYVHEMRVAIRRLRAAIRGFRKSFEGGLQPESRRLRKLADALGPVRDADVFLDFLQTYGRKSCQQRRPFLVALVRDEQRQRRATNRALLKLCRSAGLQLSLAGFYARVREPFDSTGGLAATPRGASRPVQKHAREVLARRLEDVAEFGRRLDDLSPGRQHDLRIACKKFRYLAEFCAELYPPALAKAVATLTRLQNLLGASHDADVYIERMDRFFEKHFGKKCRGRAEATLRLLRAHLKRRKKLNLARAEFLWQSLLTPRHRRTLEELLASPRRAR